MLLESWNIIKSTSDKTKGDLVINNKSQQIFIKCRQARLNSGRNQWNNQSRKALYGKNFPSSGRIIYTQVFIRDLDVYLRPKHLAYSKGRLFVFIPEPGHLFVMIYKKDSIYKCIVCGCCGQTLTYTGEFVDLEQA